MAVLLLAAHIQPMSDENNSFIFRVTFKSWPLILLLIPIPSQKERKKLHFYIYPKSSSHVCTPCLCISSCFFISSLPDRLSFFTAPWFFPIFAVPLRFAIHLDVDLHFVQKSWMKLLLIKIRWLPWETTKELYSWHDSSPTDQFTVQATAVFHFVIFCCHYIFFYQQKLLLLWNTGSKCPVRKEQPYFHF